MDEAAFRALAARIADDTRRFDRREGLSAADGRLRRLLLAAFGTEGRHDSAEHLDRLVQAYYQRRNWTRRGIPKDTPAK
jgi:aldehyde:ferredoxin oxidoreductase